MNAFKGTPVDAVKLGEVTIPNDATPEQIVRAVEPMLKAMAAKAWAMHPNNPKNKAALREGGAL
jgi:hypothetical protein